MVVVGSEVCGVVVVGGWRGGRETLHHMQKLHACDLPEAARTTCVRRRRGREVRESLRVRACPHVYDIDRERARRLKDGNEVREIEGHTHAHTYTHTLKHHTEPRAHTHAHTHTIIGRSSCA